MHDLECTTDWRSQLDWRVRLGKSGALIRRLPRVEADAERVAGHKRGHRRRAHSGTVVQPREGEAPRAGALEARADAGMAGEGQLRRDEPCARSHHTWCAVLPAVRSGGSLTLRLSVCSQRSERFAPSPSPSGVELTSRAGLLTTVVALADLILFLILGSPSHSQPTFD
jgi:hypothetical protein